MMFKKNTWPYSNSHQFYAVVSSADKDPHGIDKLSNLTDSRRYLRNALPPCTKMPIAGSYTCHCIGILILK
jgi:hypothetical protein